jgi:hypothetical protein
LLLRAERANVSGFELRIDAPAQSFNSYVFMMIQMVSVVTAVSLNQSHDYRMGYRIGRLLPAIVSLILPVGTPVYAAPTTQTMTA